MTFQAAAPKALGNPDARVARLARVDEPHVLPLNRLARRIRQDTGLEGEVPYFDPDDGGIEARCLFLLEAPGPQAVASGFVSRDNPDETAKNFLLLNREAGLERRLTVSWNIVPWYIGTGSKIRSAGSDDIARGSEYLEPLLASLPRLRVVVLVGRKAQRAEPRVRDLIPAADVVHMLHLSPLVLNTNKAARGVALGVLKQVAAAIA